ncbi:MAG: 5-oxoprolinase subunit PxpB [Treponema sp.]|nr:5-oxoprolinase subunit PxpB [Treponema sp.]
MRFLPAGDSALVVEFGNEISEAINRKIRFVTGALDRAKLAGVLDLTPTYRSILVNFDALRVSASGIRDFVTKAFNSYSESSEASGGEVIEIPVLYGGEAGPDLDFICGHTKLDKEEVIRRHSSVEYLVYMLGFTPGFAYLGGMPKELATPRLAKPRAVIPAGSVGIAAAQTGIYPVESPGGWQLLGRTPLKVFNYERAEPFLLSAGDYLKFVPVSEKEYAALEKAENEGTCRPKRYRKTE